MSHLIILSGHVNWPEKEVTTEEHINSTAKEARAGKVVKKIFLEATEAKDKHEVSGFLSWKEKRKGEGRRAQYSKWKKSWCVLMDRVIYFYNASEDIAAVKTLPVLGWELSKVRKIQYKVSLK